MKSRPVASCCCVGLVVLGANLPAAACTTCWSQGGLRRRRGDDHVHVRWRIHSRAAILPAADYKPDEWLELTDWAARSPVASSWCRIRTRCRADERAPTRDRRDDVRRPGGAEKPPTVCSALDADRLALQRARDRPRKRSSHDRPGADNGYRDTENRSRSPIRTKYGFSKSSAPARAGQGRRMGRGARADGQISCTCEQRPASPNIPARRPRELRLLQECGTFSD